MKVDKIALGAKSPEDIIKILMQRPANLPELPDLDALNKSLDVKKHEVYDTVKRPNKFTYPDPKTDNLGNVVDKGPAKIELVNRIGLAIQKLIIKRAVAFIFGNPVIKNYVADTPEEKAFIDTIEAFLDDNNEDMLNRKAARSVFSYKEVAEYWFTAPADKHSEYGFEKDRKLKCFIFSPKNGDKLYPKFNDYGNLVAFSRGFTIVTDELTTEYFETFTDEEIVRWKKSSITDTWEEYDREAVPIKKIPVVYGFQEEAETADVDDIISRLEKMFSNLGDTNDYHSAPKIFVKGKILSFGSKGSSNSVIQGDQNTSAEYLSWDHAPESWKLEAEQLLKLAFMITQTPDISFDSVKGIGTLSGVALKLLFLDAHLKVKDKEEIFLPYLKRRYSILKAYAVEMNKKYEKASSIRIKPQIDPYMIADDLAQAQILQIANGAKPFISQEESVKQWGGTNEDYLKIIEEKKEDSNVNLFEPTV